MRGHWIKLKSGLGMRHHEKLLEFLKDIKWNVLMAFVWFWLFHSVIYCFMGYDSFIFGGLLSSVAATLACILLTEK